MKKKRILQVVHSLPVAGTEMLVARLALRLSRDYEMGVCCLDEKGKLTDELEAHGIPVYLVGRRPGRDLRAACRLRRIIRELSPNIIHAHQYTPFFYSALAKAPNATLMFTEHGRHYPDLVSWKRRFFNLWLQRRADWVGAVCEFSRRRLIEREGFKRLPIEIIYNGIPIDGVDYGDPEKTRENLGIPKKAKVVGFAGRLCSIKNPFLLIQAFAKAALKFPELYLAFVGDGELRLELEKETANKGIKNSVSFCGTRFPIYPYLKIMDLFVLPSLSEGASVTLLEAMAAQIPVVVTDVGGNREIVEDKVTGLVVPNEDAENMARAIEDFVRDPKKFAEMASNAYKMVREKFTEEQMLKCYSKVYETLG